MASPNHAATSRRTLAQLLWKKRYFLTSACPALLH